MTDGAGAVSRATGAALWQAVFRPETVDRPADPRLPVAAARLADLTSPALAAFLLAPANERLGVTLIDPAAVRASLLEARFTRAAQLKCAIRLADAGIDVIYFKGFANAHTLYPDPDLRLFGDLDVLIERRDLARAVELLGAAGFSFRPDFTPRWGFQAEGSFVPFASADDACNLDLHLEPDSYPINQALDAGRVRAQARTVKVGSLAVRVPSLEHTLVLGLSNIAKDKIGPFAVRKLIDLARLLRSGSAFDWDEIRSLLERGRIMGPSRAVIALLARLGADLPQLPEQLARPPAGLARREFERLLGEYLELLPREPGLFGLLRREFLLSAGPLVSLHLNGRRLAGLFRPRRGVPSELDLRPTAAG